MLGTDEMIVHSGSRKGLLGQREGKCNRKPGDTRRKMEAKKLLFIKDVQTRP